MEKQIERITVSSVILGQHSHTPNGKHLNADAKLVTIDDIAQETRDMCNMFRQLTQSNIDGDVYYEANVGVHRFTAISRRETSDLLKSLNTFAEGNDIPVTMTLSVANDQILQGLFGQFIPHHDLDPKTMMLSIVRDGKKFFYYADDVLIGEANDNFTIVLGRHVAELLTVKNEDTDPEVITDVEEVK